MYLIVETSHTNTTKVLLCDRLHTMKQISTVFSAFAKPSLSNEKKKIFVKEYVCTSIPLALGLFSFRTPEHGPFLVLFIRNSNMQAQDWQQTFYVYD